MICAFITSDRIPEYNYRIKCCQQFRRFFHSFCTIFKIKSYFSTFLSSLWIFLSFLLYDKKQLDCSTEVLHDMNILFCHIAWMHRYHGPDEEDPPMSSTPEETAAHRSTIFQFSQFNRKYYGYAPVFWGHAH